MKHKPMPEKPESPNFGGALSSAKDRGRRVSRHSPLPLTLGEVIRLRRLRLGFLLLVGGCCADPAVARLTHGEQTRVPRPIYDAYVAAANAGGFYVCSSEKGEITDELTRDLIFIQDHYMANFNAEDGPSEFSPSPTHCPSPPEDPHYRSHLSAYRRAVRHLSKLLQTPRTPPRSGHEGR
jgi:hypothetical protein